ncbi:MAG: hypothetical protein HXS50_05470, partial [Theionarchaea archaeon]|nr:hypothetical protein [Theionarchaea archaeon]
MTTMGNWLSRSEVYGEAIRDLVHLSRYRFDLVTHVPNDPEWMGRLRELGSRPIPYITMYQQPMYSTYQGIDMRNHTDWVEVDEEGRWKRTSFWDTEDQKNWYITCPNVQDYVDAILKHVGSLMEGGAGGIFVDNIGGRMRCYGPEFGLHDHLFPDQTTAFASLLGRVREVIREHDPDGVLLINSASPDTLPDQYWEVADADMAESYICTWVSNQRWMDWHDQWNAMGKKVARWMERGKTVLALSYLGHTHFSLKEDAYFCYCSARLSNFLWSAGGDVLSGDPAEVLYSIRLGDPVGPEEESGGVHHRYFQRGLVVVNPEKGASKIRIEGRSNQVIYDLYYEAKIGGPGEGLEVHVPGNSGRVYLYQPEKVAVDPEPNVLSIKTKPPLGNVRFLVDGIEVFTKSGRWKIEYDKGPEYGTLVSRYAEAGVHVVEVIDPMASGLEISTKYGSAEKLGRLMDPAEPTKPAGTGEYRFVEWRIGSRVQPGSKVDVEVDGPT